MTPLCETNLSLALYSVFMQGHCLTTSLQIACVSRNRANPLDGGLQVGSLLLAFLPTSLQEQISSRKYFYKSGRLIKDGIITLSNTDFSRDIMDQVRCLPPCLHAVHLH